MQVNQIVTIRDITADTLRRQEITGGTVIKVSATGRKVEVACDAGVRIFHKSPRNGIFYEEGSNKFIRLVA